MSKVTWSTRKGPMPIESLATDHLYNIVRFLIKQAVPKWRKAVKRKIVPEALFEFGPLLIAEGDPRFQAILTELENRDTRFSSLYAELQIFSRDLGADSLNVTQLTMSEVLA